MVTRPGPSVVAKIRGVNFPCLTFRIHPLAIISSHELLQLRINKRKRMFPIGLGVGVEDLDIKVVLSVLTAPKTLSPDIKASFVCGNG